MASHGQGLEGSQTSPRRPKLQTSPSRLDSGTLRRASREATSSRPLYKMAALSVASGRLPGTTQRSVCPSLLFRVAHTTAQNNCHTSRRSREPPAYQPIELPSYKAAPLQAFGPPLPWMSQTNQTFYDGGHRRMGVPRGRLGHETHRCDAR